MNPIPLWVRKIWNAWDIRAMVLLSLILQITLFIFGSRRRSSVKSRIIFTVWIAYLAADWLATAAIAKLTEAQADSSNTISPTNQLRALWAPFIFLHLGGPDTITAYAFEDSKLWLRHLVVTVGQSVLAIYVVVLSWTGSWLSFLTFPIFLAGVIKNGERVFALISKGIWHIAIISPRDVDVDNSVYDKCRKWALADQLLATFRPNVLNYVSVGEYIRPSLQQENILRFRHVALSTSSLLDKVNSMDIIELFDIIEIELGFMFDVLYTKNNNLTYTSIGCILRCISFSCSLCTFLVFFSIIFVEKSSCHCYSDIDISITAVLLVGAVVLELYGIAMALSSEQAMLWITRATQHHGNGLVWKIFNSFPWLFAGHKKKRYWSNSMGQFSLLSFCFNHRPGKISRILEMLGIDKMLRWFWHKRFLAVPPSLKPLIRDKLLEKLATNYMELKWSCTGSVFVERIITWHIATDICYHDTFFSNMGDKNEAKETSKILSDYMMYLLVMHPSMFLPAHHHELRLYELDQARNILTQFFEEQGTSTDIRQDYTLLLRKGAGSDDEDAISKSKLLAEDLRNKVNKWDFIQNEWVEMLCYAAINSEQASHAQELRCGGQFLTHLWLLFLHKLVASYQYRMVRMNSVRMQRPNQL